MNKQFPLFLATLMVSMVVSPGLMLGASIDAPTLTQLMIEDEGQDMVLLGLGFGVVPSSPISFTTAIDAAAGTYSYTSNPGSMYNGQSVSIAGTAIFDMATSSLSTSSSITLGSTTYALSGTTLIDLLANPKKDTAKGEIDPPLPIPNGPANDIEGDTTESDDGKTTDTLHLTKDGKEIPGTAGPSNDVYSLTTGTWNFNQAEENVFVTSTGSSPIGGGAGTFTSSLSSIPEPAASVLLVTGLSVLIGLRMRRA